MNQVNRTFRNLAGLIILIVLAAAVFWLVSSQADSASQLTAQSPDPTAVTPEPTNPPFTPEEVTGKVTLITPPPPPPTIGPGPLAKYGLSEPTLIPREQNGQFLHLLGFSRDGNRLLTYSLPEGNATQPTTLTSLVIGANLTEQSIQSHTLTIDSVKLQYTPGYLPIQPLGQTDYVIYRETLEDNLFEFKLGDIQNQNSRSIGQATFSKFAVSDEGLLAYINNNQIIITNVIQKPTILNQLSLTNYNVNFNSEYFGMSLAPKGKYIAIFDEGLLEIIEPATGNVIGNHQPDEGTFFHSVKWSPDTNSLAFIIQNKAEDGFPGNVIATLNVIEPNGGNFKSIEYNLNGDGEPVSIFDVQWLGDSQTIVGVAGPYMCNLCRDTIVLISKDGLYLQELLRTERRISNLQLFSQSQSIAYECSLPEIGEANICIAKIQNN